MILVTMKHHASFELCISRLLLHKRKINFTFKMIIYLKVGASEKGGETETDLQPQRPEVGYVKLLQISHTGSSGPSAWTYFAAFPQH